MDCPKQQKQKYKIINARTGRKIDILCKGLVIYLFIKYEKLLIGNIR